MSLRLAACLVAAALPLSAAAAPENYVIDPYHTYPYFEVEHVGMSWMRGRFEKTTGRFTLDAAAKTGTVELTVPTATIATGDNERGERARARDEHLRTPDFMNAAEFPTMTFRGNATKWNGDAPAEIVGQLTLLGVTKPLTLTVLNWKCGPDPRTQGKRYMCGANATGSFKRSEFGMKFGIPGVSDEVRLWVGLEGFRQ